MKCYCKERKGHWYFRMRIPKELHPYLPSEISYSIKGLDLETARFRCNLNFCQAVNFNWLAALTS